MSDDPPAPPAASTPIPYGHRGRSDTHRETHGRTQPIAGEDVWLTHAAAARVLGVHPQTVERMIVRGHLHSRGRFGPQGSIRADQVDALKAVRMHAATLRDTRRREAGAAQKVPKVRTSGVLPPDSDHAWLSTSAAARLMGVTRAAISQRARRGRLPFVEKDARRWFRRDLLLLVRNADAAKRSEAAVRSTATLVNPDS